VSEPAVPPPGPDGADLEDASLDGADLTGSPTDGRPGVKVVWDRLLDAVVFVPVGFAAETVEQLPHWAAKGRSRLGMHVSNAKVTGQFVMGKAQRDLTRRTARLRPAATRTPAAARHTADDAPWTLDEAPTALPGDTPVGSPAGVGAQSLPSARATSAAAAAAIEGYDTLSASQVVRRLDGLGPEELRAVYRHEAATRGRRTILHRVQQLLQPPAPAAANGTGGTGGGAGTAEPA
jgi:hypothetical protein